MLQKIDKDRLDKVLQILKDAEIRFPVAEIVRRTSYKKGHVSNVLNGTIPMSSNFYDTFLDKFQDVGKPDPEKELLKKRVEDLEKIITLLEKDKEKNASTPSETMKRLK